jgi:hypothetical protein
MDRKDNFLAKKKSSKKSQCNNLKGLFSDSEQADFMHLSVLKDSICGGLKNLDPDMDTSYNSMDESSEDDVVEISIRQYSLSLKEKDNSSINLRNRSKRKGKKDKKPKEE